MCVYDFKRVTESCRKDLANIKHTKLSLKSYLKKIK